MQYSDDYLREFLPRENPPFELVPIDVIREMESRPERYRGEGGLADRSRLWTYAMFSEMALGQVRVHGFRSWRSRSATFHPDVAIGLFDHTTEQPGFGLSVNSVPFEGSGFQIVGDVEFTRLRHVFPFALRATVSELHGPVNPGNATAACWAKCNQKGSWGIVTAAHAVGAASGGQTIVLDDGSTGIAEAHFFQPVDAAMVLTAAPLPLPAPLPIINFPATGDAVQVLARSGLQSRSVVSVCNPQGFYRTRSFPVLFFLDNPCVAGDSGSLVRFPTGEACGIYCGSEPAPDTGGVTGRALNFAQAMFALDVTPYL